MSEQTKTTTDAEYTGMKLLNQWTEVAYMAFHNQADRIPNDQTLSQESKDMLLARAAMSMHAIKQFQENGMSKIEKALSMMEHYYDLELKKVANGDLTVTEEEKAQWLDDLNFCQVMLRGKSEGK